MVDECECSASLCSALLCSIVRGMTATEWSTDVLLACLFARSVGGLLLKSALSVWAPPHYFCILFLLGIGGTQLPTTWCPTVQLHPNYSQNIPSAASTFASLSLAQLLPRSYTVPYAAHGHGVRRNQEFRQLSFRAGSQVVISLLPACDTRRGALITMCSQCDVGR